MHSSSFESSSSRIIPTRYETEFWRSPRWDPPRWDPPRWELTPVSHTPSFPTSFPPPPPPEFSSSLVHYPSRERQQVDFEREMRRMNEEMNRMMENFQRSAPPLQNVDDWRLTENFRMENPIQTYVDGTRKFRLEFDMRQFKPEEIQVKTSGNTLTVTAKHDEKDSSKSVFREYNRSYILPKDVHAEQLTSKLSTAGVLTIEAPLPAIEGPREKLIPIKHN